MITHSDIKTQEEGEMFSKKLIPSDVVFLEGDLGSGKTTFIKGVCKGLGVMSRVISPTFVIVRIYSTHREDIRRIYHLDLYRLASEKEVKAVDLKDFINDKNAVTLIEWPEISKNIINRNYWVVRIKDLLGDKREIEIRRHEQ